MIFAAIGGQWIGGHRRTRVAGPELAVEHVEAAGDVHVGRAVWPRSVVGASTQ
jgi:hypothetical protein